MSSSRFFRVVRNAVPALALGALLISTSSPFAEANGKDRAYTVRYQQTAGRYLKPVRLIGASPYICTPSGFGQKARCYLRNA